MNYSLHQLRIFLKVVELKNITKAAEQMHITQPALSMQLKNFQGQFNMPLYEYVSKRIIITDFGQKIATLAKSTVEQSDQIKYHTKAYQNLFSGELKISSASTGKYVIPYFLEGFIEKHKGIDLNLDVSNKRKVIEDLNHKLIDFALVSVVPDNLEIEQELLIDNKLYLVGKNTTYDHTTRLIYREEGSATRAVMDAFFEAENQRKSLKLTSNEAVKQAVIAGLGISILPIIGIKHELSSGTLKIIPKKILPIVTKWRLIWLKNRVLSPVAQAYLAYVREHKESIQKNNFKWVKKF